MKRPLIEDYMTEECIDTHYLDNKSQIHSIKISSIPEGTEYMWIYPNENYIEFYKSVNDKEGFESAMEIYKEFLKRELEELQNEEN